MDRKTDIKKELENLSSVLLSFKEKDTTPLATEGYFDGLADQIIDTIQHQEFQKTKEGVLSFDIFHHPKLIPYLSRLSVAATLAGIIILGVLGYKDTIHENICHDGIACLTQDEIYQYVHANSNAFEVEEIQEGMKIFLENDNTSMGIQTIEVIKYIDQNKNMLDTEDAATDIF